MGLSEERTEMLVGGGVKRGQRCWSAVEPVNVVCVLCRSLRSSLVTTSATLTHLAGKSSRRLNVTSSRSLMHRFTRVDFTYLLYIQCARFIELML